MISEKSKKNFGNIPEEMKNLPNWVLSQIPKGSNKGKLPYNVNFLRFTDTIKNLDGQTKLIKIYDYIKSNNLTPKFSNEEQKTTKRTYLDLTSIDTLIEDLKVGNVSSKPESTYLDRLSDRLCFKCYPASSSNPKTFTTFDDAFDFLQSDHQLLKKLEVNTSVIGFELINTPYFVIDIDKPKKLGYIDSDTVGYVKEFDTYTEMSQSGLGFHIFGKGTKRIDSCKNTELNIELYDSNRYIAMTGNIYGELGKMYDTIEDRQEILQCYEESVFKKELDRINNKTTNKTKSGKDTNNVVMPEVVKSKLTDKQVIDLVLKNDNDGKFANAFYNGILVDDDDSSTDMLVCDRIATITKDPMQIQSIWFTSNHTNIRSDISKLNRNDYVEMTINKALGYANSLSTSTTSTVSGNEELLFDPTPLGFANHLKGKIQDLIYIPEYDTKASYTGYFLYNGMIWDRLTNSQVIKYLGDFLTDYVSNNYGYLENNKEFSKFFKTLKNTNGIKQVLTFLQADITEKNPNKFNQDRYKICVSNGIVDLITGQLMPFDKNYYFNYQLNITYNPDLDMDFSKCKFYNAFRNIFEVSKEVSNIIPDPYTNKDTENITLEVDEEDTIKTLNCIQRILGYALTGDISKHKIFIMVGKGRNGKSVLQNILLNILGDFGFTGQQDTVLLDRWGNNSKSHLMIDLKDKRSVFFNEFNPNQTLNVGRLKNLSGGDKITGDAKFVDTMNFNPTCKIFLTSNYIPCFDSSSSAITERLIIIPFNNIFSKNEDAINKGAKPLIENLDTKLLEEEKDLIFKWMVKGSVDFYSNNRDFALSNIIEEKTKEVILEFNPLGEFLDLFLPTGRVKKKHLWCLYSSYVGNNKIYKDKNTLSNALCNSNWNNNSIEKYKSDSRWLKGISININNEWIQKHLSIEDGKPTEDSQGNLSFFNLGGNDNEN